MSIPKLYTQFAEYYDQLESQYRDYWREARWIEILLESNDSRRVIDVSCGTGSHLEALLKLGKEREYFGMDFSSQMVRIAHRKLDHAPTSAILRADFLKTPFCSSAFDTAMCMYWSLAGLGHAQVKQLFSEVSRILQPGGLFIFDVENAEGIKENLLGTPFIDAFFSDVQKRTNVIRANLSTKIAPDVVDWHAYYLLETEGVSELISDEMKLRFYSRSTLESILRDCSFKVKEIASSPGEPYHAGSPSLYFVSKKTK